MRFSYRSSRFSFSYPADPRSTSSSIVTLQTRLDGLAKLDIEVDYHLSANHVDALALLARSDAEGCLACLAAEANQDGLAFIIRACAMLQSARYLQCVSVIESNPGAREWGPLISLILVAAHEGLGNNESAVSAAADSMKRFIGVSVKKSFERETTEQKLIASGVCEVLSAPIDARSASLVAAVASALKRTGALEGARADLCPALPSVARAVARVHGLTWSRIQSAFDILGLFDRTSFRWQDEVFSNFVVPLMEELIELGLFLAAVAIEIEVYNRYVKSRETAEHFSKVYEVLAPVMEKAGRRLAISPPAVSHNLNHPYRVAVVIPNLVYLAHTSTMLDTLESMTLLSPRRIEPVIFGIGVADKQTALRCAEIGIALEQVTLPQHSDPVSLLIEMRRRIHDGGFAAAVWVSVPPLCAFAMSLRLAPVQIYFAMKYHSLHLRDIDGYVTGGAIGQQTKSIDGRIWRTGPTYFSNLYDPNKAETAAKIRAKFASDAILLASLGREEKLNSIGFLDAVISILKADSRCVFLWSGRVELLNITRRFREAGVEHQTRFIGWVDTRIYAQVLDIFLDSFPFPCGLTLMQAMAAGKPVVFFNSREAMETGVAMLIEPLLSSNTAEFRLASRAREIFNKASEEPLFLFARDCTEYIRYALQLVRDSSFRAKVGLALKTFSEEFLTNKQLCGQAFETHFIEVIKEASNRGAVEVDFK